MSYLQYIREQVPQHQELKMRGYERILRRQELCLQALRSAVLAMYDPVRLPIVLGWASVQLDIVEMRADSQQFSYLGDHRWSERGWGGSFGCNMCLRFLEEFSC